MREEFLYYVFNRMVKDGVLMFTDKIKDIIFFQQVKKAESLKLAAAKQYVDANKIKQKYADNFIVKEDAGEFEFLFNQYALASLIYFKAIDASKVAASSRTKATTSNTIIDKIFTRSSFLKFKLILPDTNPTHKQTRWLEGCLGGGYLGI